MGEVGRIKTGLEVFLAGHSDMTRKRRVGLLTHAAAVDRRLRSAVDLLADAGVNLVALYGPEHGVRGNAQAGVPVALSRDAKYGIPVYSLYDQDAPAQDGRDPDERMRHFDSRREGKALTRDMVEGVDLMLCDLQDVGTRVYTYAATLLYAMETCAAAGIELVVLDRPNPIGGTLLEGPVLEYPAYASPLGVLPLPLRHGLTVGELALLANDFLLAGRAQLTVIRLKGWRRHLWFDQTDLPWVMPSPNMPTLETATVYPGQVFFEGTTLSEGRGTTRPFELIGAPWLDGPQLAARLNALELPGVVFREAWFTPTFSKHAGKLCSGIQLHVTDRRRYRPFAVMLHTIRAVIKLAPANFLFHADYFDQIMGTARIRNQLESGAAVSEIMESFAADLRRFARSCRRYLLYR